MNIFMLSGFSTLQEKKDLEEKIHALGGKILNQDTWDTKCTHIIVKDFGVNSEKVMGGLAAGRWILTRRYIERSYREGNWEDPERYVADKSVLMHKVSWSLNESKGGCYSKMRVALLMEDKIKCAVYSRVVRAGGGMVIDKIVMETMAEGGVNPSDLTHVFIDPEVIHENHDRHEEFSKWNEICKASGGKTPWHLHYKFLIHLLRVPGLSETNYVINNPKIQEMTQIGNVMKMKQKGKRISHSFVKRVGMKKKQRTNDPDIEELIELDNSDDDDIEVLEERMAKEAKKRMLEGRGRRYVRKRRTYKQMKELRDKVKITEVVELDSDSDSEKVTRNEVVTLDSDSDDEDVLTNEREESFNKNKVDKTKKNKNGGMLINQHEEKGEAVNVHTNIVSDVIPIIQDVNIEDDIGKTIVTGNNNNEPKMINEETIDKIIENKGSIEEPIANHQETNNVHQPAHNLEDSLQSRGNLDIDQPSNVNRSSSILHKVLATLLDRQDRTGECLAISNNSCRTVRFDKAGEVHQLSGTRIRPIDVTVVEEFRNAKKVHAQEEVVLDGNDGGRPDEFDVLARLKKLMNFTSFLAYPTSGILNMIMKDCILNQKSVDVARQSYSYLDHFLFLHLGKSAIDRGHWLRLILSSLRDCDESVMNVFSLDSDQDLHACWSFFRNVLSRVEKESSINNNEIGNDNAEEFTSGAEILLDFLVKLLQRDFEVWWKHSRRTEQRDNFEQSHPLLYYVLGGKKNLVNNACRSVLSLYRTRLMSQGDLTNSRKMLSMVALLLSHIDSRDEAGWLRGGEKMRLAVELKKIIVEANLSGNETFVELSLVQPSWLSVLVSQEIMKIDEKPLTSFKEITDGFHQVAAAGDPVHVAVMENLVHRLCGYLQCHSIFRVIWHHSMGGQDLETFRHMNKIKEPKSLAMEKIVKFKSDIQMKITDLVADMNSLREYATGDIQATKVGALPSVLFKMILPTQF